MGAQSRRPSGIRELLKESEYSRLVNRASGTSFDINTGKVTTGFCRSADFNSDYSGGSIRNDWNSEALIDSNKFEGTSAKSALLHSKVEALLKLLAQSVHVVFSSLCSRKARRKDRECTSLNESKLYLQEAVLERNIPETDLKQLVDLPPGLGYEEWLASHTIDFFHHINLLYGTVCEFCTLTACPDMSAPGLRHYLWFDEKGKKTRVAAPQYVDYVMTFTQNTVNDETIFPTKFENDFPSSFESIVKKIHRLLFHVVAHMYHAHFREVVLLSLHSHLNCLFAHFVLFNDKFRLIDEKETEILHDLVVALKIHPANEVQPSVADDEYSSPEELRDMSTTGDAVTEISHLEGEDNNCSQSTTSFSNSYNSNLRSDDDQNLGHETSLSANVTQVLSDDALDAPFLESNECVELPEVEKSTDLLSQVYICNE